MNQMSKDLVRIDARASVNLEADNAEELEKELAEMLGETVAIEEEIQEEAEPEYPLGYTIELKSPILGLDGNYIKEVSFIRDIEGEQLMKMGGNGDMGMKTQLAFIGHCTGLSSREVLRLKSPDVMRCVKVVGSFLLAGPKIG